MDRGLRDVQSVGDRERSNPLLVKRSYLVPDPAHEHMFATTPDRTATVVRRSSTTAVMGRDLYFPAAEGHRKSASPNTVGTGVIGSTPDSGSGSGGSSPPSPVGSN